jgi:hypothetical protein
MTMTSRRFVLPALAYVHAFDHVQIPLLYAIGMLHARNCPLNWRYSRFKGVQLMKSRFIPCEARTFLMLTACTFEQDVLNGSAQT